MAFTISKYDNLWYDSGPVSTSEFIEDIPNKIHKKLYEDALARFLDKEKWAKSCDIIENRNSDFKLPSYIVVIDRKVRPMKKHTYWLGKYWNNEYVLRNSYSMNIVGVPPDSEIDYIDYVNGQVDMGSKYEGITSKVKFSSLNKDSKLSENYYVYPETFEYKDKNFNNGMR